jgi:hypothetical protein
MDKLEAVMKKRKELKSVLYGEVQRDDRMSLMGKRKTFEHKRRDKDKEQEKKEKKKQEQLKADIIEAARLQQEIHNRQADEEGANWYYRQSDIMRSWSFPVLYLVALQIMTI